jgi:predicted secreted protein
MKRKEIVLAISIALLIIASGINVSAASNQTVQQTSYIPLEQWNRTFGGADDEWGSSAQQTSDGGYIITGRTESYGAGGRDVWLIKTDKNGNEEWKKTFGGADDDFGGSVQQTSDGGYIITGGTRSYGTGDDDVWLIKTDKNGNEEWKKTFGGADDDWGSSAQQTSDGGYIITGRTESYGAGGWDVWLIKTVKNGNEEWKKTFGGANNDASFSVQQTPDGGYIITGTTRSYGAGGCDVWLIKTDKNGKEEWEKTFGGANDDQGWSVNQTSDGGYIITGFTWSYGAGGCDVWLIKTDKNGKEEWKKTFGGADDDFGSSVQQTSDGGYIITGHTRSYGAGEEDAWLIKTDKNGKEEWEKTFGDAYYDRGNSAQQTSDSGYMIAGVTNSYDAGGRDVWLIKLAGRPETTVSVKNQPKVSEGENFTATVNINDGSTLAILMFKLTYDPSVVELTNIERGSDVSDWSHWYSSRKPSTLKVFAFSEPSCLPISGDAELAKLEFKVVGTEGDKSGIDIQGVICDSNVEPTESKWVDSEVTVI